MGIFYRRPLFCICAALMLGLTVGCLAARAGMPALPVGLLLAALCLAAGILVVILCRRSDKRRGLWAAVFGLVLSAAVLWGAGTVKGALREDSFGTYAADTDGTVWRVTGEVMERLSDGSQITTYRVRVDTVNGERVGSRLRPQEALLSCAYACDLQPGFTVDMVVRPVSVLEVSGFMGTSYEADGMTVGLVSEVETDYTVLSETPTGLRGLTDALRRRLAAQLDLLVGAKGRGLPSALLLGERGYIDPVLRRDFGRAGVSHLLAISGLHMTLLFGLWAALLKRLTVPKPVRGVLLLLLSVCYLWLLGFPPSATRAVIMLGAIYLSWLWGQSSDPLTSLGLAGALILGIDPFTVMDVGFWMSFSAALGLVTVMPLLQWSIPSGRQKTAWKRLIKRARIRVLGLAVAFLAGIIAMSFSLWVTSFVYGTISLWSPFITLLLTPFCAFLLIASPLVLPLAGTVAGDCLLIPAIRAVCGWMAGLSGAVSSLPFGNISVRGTACAVIIVVMTLALLCLLAVRLPHGRRWAVCLPILCGWVLLIGAVGLTDLIHRNEVTVTYRQTSAASEALVLTHGSDAVICDLSDGSLTAMSTAVRQAEALGTTEVSAVILTHYHSRMPGMLYRLFSSERVRLLYLPEPLTEDDWYLFSSVLDTAERAGVPVRLYRPGDASGDGDALTLFGGTSLSLYTDRIGRSAQPVLLVSVRTARDSLLYAGSALMESNLGILSDRLAAGCGTLIFGGHGPLYKQAYGLPEGYRAEVVCFGGTDAAAYFDTGSLSGTPPVLLVGGYRGMMVMDK